MTTENTSSVIYTRSIAKALEQLLAKHEVPCNIEVVGEDASQEPQMEWPTTPGLELGVLRQASEGNRLRVVADPCGDANTLLIVESLATDKAAADKAIQCIFDFFDKLDVTPFAVKRTLAKSAQRISEFFNNLDVTPFMQSRETDFSGTIGKHSWCVREAGEDGFSVFVDDRQLSYRATLLKAQAYAKQIIKRIQDNGDYYLYDKPAGFVPEAKAPTTLRVERFNVRIVRKGDAFGDDCLAREMDIPLVEFYDAKQDVNKFGPLGQFVSRYFCSTILEASFDDGCGLSLDGGVAAWSVSAAGMKEVQTFIRGNVQGV